MDNYERLVEEHGTPLYVTDLDKIEDQYCKLDRLQDIKIRYACKSNFDPLVLRRLQANNRKFAAGSSHEAMIAYNNAIEPDRLQVAAVSPSSQSVGQLVRLSNVTKDFTVVANDYDTCQELCSKGFRGRVLIRLKADKSHMSSEKYSNGSYMKFGMTEGEIRKSLDLIDESDSIFVGFHSHLGGSINNEDIPVFRDHCKDVIQRSKQHVPLSDIDVINFGGGLGITQGEDDEDLNLSRINNELSSVLQSPESIDYIVEPGRYISAESTVLLTEVRSIKQSEDGRFVGVDAGMSQFPRTTMFDVYHPIKNLSGDSCELEQTVAGPTCSGADIFCHQRKFEKCRKGDVLALKNVGAYGFVMAGNFHGYPYPKIVDLEGNESPISEGI